MDSQLVRSLVSLAVSLVVVALLLFVPAGTIGWNAGWWWMAVFLASIAVAMAILWRVNPEIFAARSRFQPGTERWDLSLMPLQIGSLIVLPVVAGLDYRFGWSAVPFSLILLGYAAFLLGVAGMTWAQAINRFFEPGVRIQTERGHHVVDRGPYALVRHPGYVGASLLAVGMALALGSWWALVPAIVAIAVLVYRTGREETTLSAELPGYADYMRRVRYRWVPGVW